MKRKTYGVPGQLECHLIIHSGTSTAKVPFRGGSIKDIVRCPARYATSKLVEQIFIENSVEFIQGKIVLMDTMEVPDDAEELARKAAETLMANRNATVQETDANTTPVADATKKNTVEVHDEVDGVQTIEVAGKSDAVEWLKEHYPEAGYTALKLRSEDAFEAACAERGVTFVYTA